MSQNDMIIANANGATARADINSALQALASTSKGNGRPSTPYAGQLWLDDNTPSSTVWTLFMYDGTDDIPMGYWDTTNNVFIPACIGAGTATIASASTVDLGSTPETSITISGTTTITSFGTSMKPGQAKIVTFSGALTLTHNGTSLILPGGANITTAAGDQAIVHCISSGNYRVMYARADGAAIMPAGSVLQTLSTTKTDTFSTTGTSFADVTGLSQAITPAAASNKVLVTVHMMLGGPAGSNIPIAQLVRNSTPINIGDTAGSRTSASATVIMSSAAAGAMVSFSFLDSPSTTSSTTYKVQLRSSASGTVYVNRTDTDTNADGFVRGASTITVQEIKG